ncbi:hypothetical protein V8G54_003602 [Vigna mungo]|uniref:Uncharacterized protein n=1 Tax=Vigna mungo TaxID=3915 RepID=A0AAQ3PE80_VIGMU
MFTCIFFISFARAIMLCSLSSLILTRSLSFSSEMISHIVSKRSDRNLAVNIKEFSKISLCLERIFLNRGMNSFFTWYPSIVSTVELCPTESTSSSPSFSHILTM